MGRRTSYRADAQAGSAQVSQLSDQSHAEPSYRESFIQDRQQFRSGKRPNADASISFDRSRQFMYQETAYFSLDYGTEVESLADPEKMARMSKIVQFEHASTVSQICITW